MMAGIWFADGCARVRSYSSTTKGQQRLVRVEIEVDDPHELGSILRQLDDMQAPKPKKNRSRQLLLEDQRGRSNG